MTPDEIVEQTNAVLARVTEARINSLRERLPIPMHRSFRPDDSGKLVFMEGWSAQDGKVLRMYRGKAVGIVHEYPVEETTDVAAAEALLRLKVPLKEIHVTPAVTMKYL